MNTITEINCNYFSLNPFCHLLRLLFLASSSSCIMKKAAPGSIIYLRPPIVYDFFNYMVKRRRCAVVEDSIEEPRALLA